MSLTGENTPGQLALEPLVPQFTVISGSPRDQPVVAIEQTNRLVNAYRVGLRDLRSPSLAVPYQEETPRSRVSSDDGQARYDSIVEASLALGIEPVPAGEFVRLFLPSSAPLNVITMLARLRLWLLCRSDVFTLVPDRCAYRMCGSCWVIGEQVANGQLVTTAVINQLLVDIQQPLAVTKTQHFVSDHAENDAIDVDRKAHQRIFSTYAQYIRDYLDL